MRKFVYFLLFAVVLFDLPIFIAMSAKQVYKYKQNSCVEQCVRTEKHTAENCEYICKYEM